MCIRDSPRPSQTLAWPSMAIVRLSTPPRTHMTKVEHSGNALIVSSLLVWTIYPEFWLAFKIFRASLFGPQSGRPARPFGIKGEDVGYARLEERIADAACKMQESRKSEIQKFRNSGIEEYRNPGMQEVRNSGIRNSGIKNHSKSIQNHKQMNQNLIA